MTDDTRAAAAATGTAAGQQISDTFTGSAGASQALKPKGPQTPGHGHGQGHPGRGDPGLRGRPGARRPRRDRPADRGAHRRPGRGGPDRRLPGPAPGPVLQHGRGRAEHDLGRRRDGRVRAAALPEHVRGLRGAARLRADPHRPGLPGPAGADPGSPLGHEPGLLRHQPPLARGPVRDAGHRGPDRGLRRRREPAPRDPAGLAGPGRAAVHPAGPRPGPRGVPGGARPTSRSAAPSGSPRAAT